MGAVAISLVRATLEECARQGVDVRPLLDRVELASDLVEDAGARIPLEQYDALQRLAIEATDDEAFGLHLGEHASVASFSTLGHMVAQCRTIREAIELALQYYRLVADVTPAPALVELGDEILFRYEFLRSTDPRLDRLRAEFGLARILGLAKILLGESTLPLETRFEHEAPSYAEEVQRVFAGTARFGAEHTGFVLPRELLERTHRHHDAQLLDVMRRQADRSLERLGEAEGVARRVRKILVERRATVRPEMDAVARELGVSSRTLRRKLTSEGVGFQQIVDDSLREVACSILRDPRRSIQEAAYELGFSDASSFHRAFKRWTGITPAVYRVRDA